MPSDGAGTRAPLSPRPVSSTGASMQVKDPVCGMMIDSEKAAAHGTYDGKVVYFCAEACRRTFEARRRPG
jgi:YHS domain-containing protein